MREVKFFCNLKYKTIINFADHLEISKTRLSTMINRDSTYIFTLLKYVLECDAMANIKIVNDKDDVVAELDSDDVYEISEFTGKVTKDIILSKYETMKDFANVIEVNRNGLYYNLESYRKTALDHLCDYLEKLEHKLQISIKKS